MGKQVLFNTPLNLSGRDSGGMVVAALSAARFSENSLDLVLSADWTLETVLLRQVLANDGLCFNAKAIEFIVVAWGLEASSSGTIIGLE